MYNKNFAITSTLSLGSVVDTFNSHLTLDIHLTSNVPYSSVARIKELSTDAM